MDEERVCMLHINKACMSILHTPHKNLLRTQRVSNPATRKDLAARTWGVFWY